MKVAISGIRTFEDYEIFKKGMEESGYSSYISLILHGDAKGVDQLADRWARENNITVKRFPVSVQEWNTYGKRAGPMRNARMLQEAEALIAFWNGESRGTKSAIDIATSLHLPVFVYRIDLRQGDNPLLTILDNTDEVKND